VSSISVSRRSPLFVLCAALALSGCMQTSGPVALKDTPGSSLDTMAYGDLRDDNAASRSTDRSSKPGRAPAGRTVAVMPPKVIMADAGAVPSVDSRESSGGLFAVLGLRGEAPAPAVMQANAELPPRPAPAAYAAAPAAAPVVTDPDYRVDSGDKLRIVVYGQEGLTNTYAIDAGGGITMPLIGRVAARGLTPSGLAAHITARLRKGYIREPSVAVEIETYRPFFILGEVAAPGQYPYVPNMSVEAAVAIAGGFSPRARRDSVTLTHKANGGQFRETVPLGTPLNPGDTIMVSERWF
jgi:polysaccharide export outer membrane protein